MDSLYPASDHELKLELPGKSGPFSVSPEQFASYAEGLRLYHLAAGEEGFRNLGCDEKNEKVRDLTRQFLAGSELTEEMLYIGGTYVERKAHVDDLAKVETALMRGENQSFSNWKSYEKQIIRFRHEPVSGVTTIARIVLWKLRQHYPCVEVTMAKELLNSIKEGARFICEAAKKSVLVLFDSKTSDLSDVRHFAASLNEFVPRPPFAVLFVERVDLDSAGQGSQNQRVLTVELSDKDAKEFDKIYNDVGGDVPIEAFADLGAEIERTPFLFGVWYFKKDYRKFDDFFDASIRDASSAKEKLLFFASISQVIIHAPLDLTVAAYCLGLQPAQGDPDRTLCALGKQRHLLTVQRDDETFFFAPVFVIGERILKHLREREHKESGKLVTAVEQLQLFASDLCTMMKSDNELLRPCLEKLVQNLLTCKVQRADKLFSPFMSHMDHCMTEIEIEELFLKLAQAFSRQKCHILVHCARYFAYKKNDHLKSMELVRKALSLDNEAFFSETRCKDSVVLGLSAHLINCRLTSGPELQFEDAEWLCCQCVKLCKQAETVTYSRKTGVKAFNAHPFCVKIEAQRILLDMFFSAKCNKDCHQYFVTMLESQYSTIKETHESIMKNIVELEKMHEERKLHRDSFHPKQTDKLNRTKFELAQRCFLGNQLNDRVFVWVAVDYYLMRGSPPNFVRSDSDGFEVDSAGQNDKSRSLDALSSWNQAWKIKNLAPQFKTKLVDMLTNCPSKLPKNYLELCILLIITKGSLATALQVSSEWCNRCDSDFLAHFMHGIFLLVLALDSPHGAETLKEAIRSLMMCNDANTRRSHTETIRRTGTLRLRVFLRSSKAAAKLGAIGQLPSTLSYEEQKTHIWREEGRKFNGILDGQGYVLCDELYDHRLHVPIGSVDNEMHNKRRAVTFALALAYSGLTPVDIQPRARTPLSS